MFEQEGGLVDQFPELAIGPPGKILFSSKGSYGEITGEVRGLG